MNNKNFNRVRIIRVGQYDDYEIITYTLVHVVVHRLSSKMKIFNNISSNMHTLET